MAFFSFPVNGPRRETPFGMPFAGFPSGGGFDQGLGMFDQQFFDPQQAGGIERVFADFFGGVTADAGAFFEGAFQPTEEQEPRQPATAATFLRTMPVVKVTGHDIQEENDECTICFDKLAVGDAALRVPCGHLFHEECARKWLETSNQCPVCRYELPTDDAAFESGRRARMMHRQPRLRVKDLAVKSIKELRYLADHLGVCVQGCLEKQDLVNAIVESGCVDIIPVLPDAPPPQPTPLLEPQLPARSLLALTDGEPVIQSFLGEYSSLAMLAKTPQIPVISTCKPNEEK